MTSAAPKVTFYIQLFLDALQRAENNKGSPLTLSERARVISVQAHSAQERFSDGSPYSVHTDFVAAGEGFSEADQAVAHLHDVIEKTALKPKDLIFTGIPSFVVRDTQRLSTKWEIWRPKKGDIIKKEIPYFDGIERILDRKRCRKIRIRDNEHNLSDATVREQQLRQAVAEGMPEKHLEKQLFRNNVLYPLGLAFLKAADTDQRWRSGKKTIIDFMRSADCPTEFQNRWDLLQGKNATHHPIPISSEIS